MKENINASTVVQGVMNSFDLISSNLPDTKKFLIKILTNSEYSLDTLKLDIAAAVRQEKLPKEDVQMLALWTAAAGDKANVVTALLEMGVDASRMYADKNAIRFCFPNRDIGTSLVSKNALRKFLENGIDVQKIVGDITELTDDEDVYKDLIKWEIEFRDLKEKLEEKQGASFPFDGQKLGRVKYFVLQLEALGYLAAGTKSDRGEEALAFLISKKANNACAFLLCHMGTKSEPRFAKAYQNAMTQNENEALEMLLKAKVSVVSDRYDPLLDAFDRHSITKFRLILNSGYNLAKNIKHRGKYATVEEWVKKSGQSEFIAAINMRKKKDLEDKNAAADAANTSLNLSRDGAATSSSNASTSSPELIPEPKPVAVTSEPVVSTPAPPQVTTPKPSEDAKRLLITIFQNNIVVMPPSGDGRMASFSGAFLNEAYMAKVTNGQVPFSKLLRTIANECETWEAMQINK